MFDRRESDSPSQIETAARHNGHPNPENATWGEVNVLSLATLRAGRPPTQEEAARILHICEFDADFNS